jgi:SAM-dependent methyltransferase
VADDRTKWTAKYAHATGADRASSPWVMARALALPDDALILDVAAGLGRHAIPLAARGRRVIALDFVERAVRLTTWGGPTVMGVVADARHLPFRDRSVDAVLCTYYLNREVFAAVARLLRPGGTLIAETYTTRHLDLVAAGRARGPRDRAVLLAPGELRQLVAPLRVVEGYEGRVEDVAGERETAGVVAVAE